MDDNTFWCRIWTLVAAGVCTLVLSIAGYTTFETYRISAAADPVAARCAIGGSDRSGVAACLVLLGRHE
jgi:hypothetical protein